MKRICLTIVFALALAALAAGCAPMPIQADTNGDFSALKEQLDGISQDITALKEEVEALKEQDSQPAVTPAAQEDDVPSPTPSAPPESTEQPPSSSTTGENASGITIAQAKQIALDHAGLLPDQVFFTKAKEDQDNGVAVYDIEFQQGHMEYEYEIRVSDGTILEWDHDQD